MPHCGARVPSREGTRAASTTTFGCPAELNPGEPRNLPAGDPSLGNEATNRYNNDSYTSDF